MTDRASMRPLRIAGAALLLGVVLSFIGAIAAIPADGVGAFDRTAWVLIHLALLLGGALGLIGLPAIYVRRCSSRGSMTRGAAPLVVTCSTPAMDRRF